jgi:competence protein ComEC
MRQWVLLAGVAFLVASAGCLGASDGIGDDSGSETPAQTGTGATPSGELKIHHIDVGQADSTLVVTPGGETVLVDTGDWRSDGERVISYLEEHGIEQIDHLVATHPHADHIGGHAAVIEYLEEEGNGVGAVYDSGQPHDTQTYENYLDTVDAYGHELLLVEEGDRLPLDSEAVEALVLNPPADSNSGEFHDNSVALVVEFGDVRYLLTGDAEREAESRLSGEWGDQLDADVYQAGHHGSSTSSTGSFLDAVEPRVAVVSSGYDSQFGHPHDEVLERFAERGIETYWTGVHGDIVVTTDGTEVTVNPAESFSTDPMDLLAEKHSGSRVGQSALAGEINLRLARGT